MYMCMHPYALVFIFNAQVLRCTYAHVWHVYTCIQATIIGLHNCLASAGNRCLAVLSPDVCENPPNSSGCWLLNVIDRRGKEANRRAVEERGGACLPREEQRGL